MTFIIITRDQTLAVGRNTDRKKFGIECVERVAVYLTKEKKKKPYTYFFSSHFTLFFARKIF